MKCPKCGGEMEKGYMGDRGHANFLLRGGLWARKINWLGTLSGAEDTTSYACNKCGFIEMYLAKNQ